jgi:hypothetical protein
MHTDYLIAQLETNPSRIRSLVEGVSLEQARWRPSPQAWSLLEVVNHLYDEEQFDFRVRLDCILRQPDEPFPAIDPQGWVTERRYNERELSSSLQNFLDERRKSLVWLRTLRDPQWDAAHEAQWGVMHAGEALAAWAAHDLLHMRQLVELHYQYTAQSAAPYPVEYAGYW